MVFSIECNRFEFLIYFDFWTTPFRIEILCKQFHKLESIDKLRYDTYFDFLFSPSIKLSSFYPVDFFISNKWIEDLLEVHAIKCRTGWKIILVINALPDPLLNSYNILPSSALNILIMVPLTDAEATSVPSALTATAPTSDSWALISTWLALSVTIKKFKYYISYHNLVL